MQLKDSPLEDEKLIVNKLTTEREEEPEYAIENPIHAKSKNIFEVISHRYNEVYHRN